MRITRAAALAVALALGGTATATAVPRVTPVAEFTAPVSVAAPAGDPRLFVAELGGRIEILAADGTLEPEPFLDLTADTLGGAERGLLSLVFSPDYDTTGLFYVYLTAKEPEGEIQVRRYRVSAGDPDRADPASGVTILRQEHERFGNHNGGGMRFGPDGKLWVALGDGGGSDDTLGSGQSLGTRLGKLLRLNPDGSAPGDNPFAGVEGARPEIWHYGLRNTFRFSFDRQTGDLVMGDVGQDDREEIDFAPAADGLLPGANWGWPCFEGTRANNPCEAPGARAPAFELDHADDGVLSITGGLVVRDPRVPSLFGRYLYGDFIWDSLHSLVVDGAGAATDERDETGLPVERVVSFDEDGCGRVVVTSLLGRVYRLVEDALTACGPPLPEPTATPTATATPEPTITPTSSCELTVKVPAERTRRQVFRRGVPVTLRPLARCTVRATLFRLGERRSPTVSRTLLPGAERTVRLKPGRRGRRALARALRRHAPISATVRLTVTAPDGVDRPARARLKIRR